VSRADNIHVTSPFQELRVPQPGGKIRARHRWMALEPGQDARP
jgi:hypothetical protein